MELARREGVRRVFVHAFMDGGDTPPKSGIDYMRRVENRLKEIGYGRSRQSPDATAPWAAASGGIASLSHTRPW